MTTLPITTRSNRTIMIAIVTLLSVGPMLGQGKFYVQAFGANKAKITGGSITKGTEGDIVGYGYSHQVSNPVPATGAASANTRSHKVITFTKGIDVSSPRFYTALNSAEVLDQVIFNFRGTTQFGADVLIYSVVLKGARVTDIQCAFGEAKSETTGFNIPATNKDMEKISLTYQQIEWVWKDGNITSTDTWK